jgi:plasmid stabilization system protein ParE
VNLNVRTTPEADDHVRAIDEWWRRNRTAAPSLFLDELAAAFALIASAPNVGHPYIEDRPSEVRDGSCWRAVGTTSTTRRSSTNWSFWQCGTPAAEVDHHFGSSSRPRPVLRAIRRSGTPAQALSAASLVTEIGESALLAEPVSKWR